MPVPASYSRFVRLLALRDRLADLFASRPRPNTSRLTAQALEDRVVPDGGRPLPFPVIYAGAGEGMAPVVRAYDAETGNPNFERAVFEPTFTGGVRVAVGDFTQDGFPDVVVASGPGGARVRVLDGKTGDQIAGPLGSFFAYNPAFTGGVHVAAADVDGDTVPDVITAAGPGGGPHVKVFSGATGAVVGDFFALDPSFRGGITVAAADLTGDGRAEIAVGAGVGGGPRVKVYDPTTWGTITGPLGSFFAFDPGFRGGVYVGADALAGDYDADGTPDLAVGSGPGMAGRLKVYSGATGAVLADFQPFGSGMTGGVRASLAYADDDGFADVVAGTGPGGPATVRVFSGATGNQLPAPVGEYTPFGTGTTSTGGVYVAASNDPTMPSAPAPTTSPAPLYANQTFTITGQVSDPYSSLTPTGTVEFKAMSYATSTHTSLGTATLAQVSAGTAEASKVVTGGLPAGMYALYFVYSGDANYSARMSTMGGLMLSPPPPPPPSTASVGDEVWYDTDADGTRDEGEFGAEGVLVTLSQNGVPSATDTTDGNGNYLFTGLAPGSYTVTVTAPGGYGFSTPTGGVVTTDLTAGEQELGVDAGLIPDPQVVTVAPLQAGTEAGAPTVFRFTRTGDSAEIGAPLTVTFSAGGTAAPEEDYASFPDFITFGPGVTEYDLEVTPTDDADAEGTETVQVTLSPGDGYVAGTPSDAVGKILDDERATVWVEGVADAAEPATNGSFTVLREGGNPDQELPVRLSAAGTATAGQDYTGVPSVVVIPAGESSVTVVVTPVRDGTVESDETVGLGIAAGEGYVVGSPTSAEIVLRDRPLVGVQASDGSISEAGDTGEFTFTRTGSLDAPLAVSYAVSGSATPGRDYYRLGGTVTIAAGQSSVTLPVNPIADGLVEGTETLVVSVTATDGVGVLAGSESASVSVTDGSTTVSNQAPDAVNDSAATDEDTPVAMPSLRYNDSDPDLDEIVITGVGAAAHGAVSLVGGLVTYTPAAGWSGTDSFTYTLSDGTLTDTATVTVTVRAVNDPPTAAPVSETTPQNTSVEVTLSGSDPEGVEVYYEILSGPTHGSLGVLDGDTVTYYPAGNFVGTDEFTYYVSDGIGASEPETVTITVTAVTQGAGVTITQTDGSTAVLEPGANPSDGDGGDTYTVVLNTQPTAQVTVTLGPDAQVQTDLTQLVFTTANWNVPQSVRLTAVDDHAVETDTHTGVVAHTVASSDTAYDGIAAPSLNVDVTDGDWAGVLVWSDDEIQTLTEGSTGGVVLQVQLASKPTASVTVTLSPDAQLTLSASSLVFTPANWDAPQAVTADAVDDTIAEGSHFGTVELTAASTDADYDDLTGGYGIAIEDNDGPSAIDDSVETDEDTAVTFSVVGNDVNPGSGSLTVASYSQPSFGSVSLNPDGTFSYTPAADWSGTDTFGYTVSDGTDVSNQATVVVSVAPVNDAPVAFDPGSRTDPESAEVSFTVSATDADGDSLVFSATGLPAGILISPGTGVIFGHLASGSRGSYTPVITVTDGEGGTDTVSFGWTVTYVNRAPFVVPSASQHVTVGATLSQHVFFTATDPDDDELTISVTGLPSWLTYDPVTRTVSGTVLQAGTVTVTVTADDGNGGMTSATFPLLTAGSPRAYYITSGPLVALVDPATLLTLVVGFDNPGDPNTYYSVNVVVNARGSVDLPTLTMKDGDTATVTYTPNAVSQSWNDITVSLIPQLAAPLISVVTAVQNITNANIALPRIDAPTTPASMTTARVSLGKDQPGSYAGFGRITPVGAPAGVALTLEIHKPVLDIKYGDIVINQGALVIDPQTGAFPITVYGLHPTLPSSGGAAANINGLGVKVVVAAAGRPPIEVPSNPFSVATLPISVWAMLPDEYSGQRLPNNGETRHIGTVVKLEYKYDGEITANFNYVGEWLGQRMKFPYAAGRYVASDDADTEGIPTVNSNGSLSLATFFTDANGITLTRPDLNLRTYRQLVSTFANARNGITTSLLQMFTFINSALDNTQGPMVQQQPNNHLFIAGNNFASPHFIKRSGFEFSYTLYYENVGLSKMYYIRVTRRAEAFSTWANSIGLERGVNVGPESTRIWFYTGSRL